MFIKKILLVCLLLVIPCVELLSFFGVISDPEKNIVCKDKKNIGKVGDIGECKGKLIVNNEKLRNLVENDYLINQNSDLSNVYTYHVTDMSYLFSNKRIIFSISDWDVSNVENMEGMFDNCDRLQNKEKYKYQYGVVENINYYEIPDITKWNISKVKNMKNMFACLKDFDQDISVWYISKDTNKAEEEKRYCNNYVNVGKIGAYGVCFNRLIVDNKLLKEIIDKNQNYDYSKIYTGQVTNMEGLFENKIIQYNISNWDVSNVKKMNKLFKNTKINREKFVNLKNWDVSNVEEMSSLFESTEFNNDIFSLSKWNVKNVKDMSKIFKNTKEEYPNFMDVKKSYFFGLKNWDVSNVENMSEMFLSSYFNEDISNWNVSNVKSMKDMFNKSIFNQDISKWDISSVQDMSGMFSESVFNQDISNWNVSKVNDMSYMFSSSKFNNDISKWDVSNVKNMSNMFYGSLFNQDIAKWNVSKVKIMKKMFKNSKFEHNISEWDVSEVQEYDNFSNMWEVYNPKFK